MKVSRFFFSVRRVKMILARDYKQLGFAGQKIWVKPGYALNFLIPEKIAKYAIPKNVEAIEAKVNFEELKEKQQQRVVDLYMQRLRNIKCTYERAVSPLNEQVIELPIQKDEILHNLAIQHGIKLQENEIHLEYTIDTVGEHTARCQFYSEHFARNIAFNVKVLVRPR